MAMSQNIARAEKRTEGTTSLIDTCKDDPLASEPLESSKASKLLTEPQMCKDNEEKKPEDI